MESVNTVVNATHHHWLVVKQRLDACFVEKMGKGGITALKSMNAAMRLVGAAHRHCLVVKQKLDT